jgi:hypothetical protein
LDLTGLTLGIISTDGRLAAAYSRVAQDVRSGTFGQRVSAVVAMIRDRGVALGGPSR